MPIGLITFLSLSCLIYLINGDPTLVSSAGDFENITHTNTTYEYGPSILILEGVYYQFYCSQGGGSARDYIRMATSSDGLKWSTPVIILQPSNLYDFQSVCDPSVINFHGVYFLYHTCINSINPPDGYTNNRICVSTSDKITGPYSTKTEPIIQDLSCSGTGPYCVGQPSALVVNDTVFVYFTNQKGNETGANPGNVYLATSKDGLTFTIQQTVIYTQRDIDVKYNRQSKLFLLVQGDIGSTTLTWSTSSDGLNFLVYDTNRNITTNPNVPSTGASNNNPGIAGLPDGTIGSGTTWVAYGSSYSSTSGEWYLYRSNLILNPETEDCSTCVGANGCDFHCNYYVGTTEIGTCQWPGSTNTSHCCACNLWTPGKTCDACAPSGCVTTCRAAGATTGVCGNPGSSDPQNCCTCLK